MLIMVIHSRKNSTKAVLLEELDAWKDVAKCADKGQLKRKEEANQSWKAVVPLELILQTNLNSFN